MTYSDRMTTFARMGFAARGLVYILIGWFALDAAVDGGALSDNQGALGTLATSSLGRVLLAACALGFAGYALWRFTEAALDPENKSRDMKGRFERAGYVVSGGAHVVLAVTAARLALRQASARQGTPGDESAQSWSGWLLDQPAGAFLLVLVGLCLFAVAAAQGVKAYKARFEDLGGDVPAPGYVRWIGRLGYAARALVFAIIGWLVVSAALHHDAAEAGGLGDALERLRAQPEGSVLLGVVACGLALFGVFSLVESRFRRLRVVKPHLG